MPNKSLQPLEEFDRIVFRRMPSGSVRMGASRSDAMPVAVGFSPRNRAAKGSPRRVATPELFATSRSRGLFYIAVPVWLSSSR
jgi:hypothetical protein